MTESEEKKEVIEALEKQLEAHDNNRKAVQDKLRKACEELHAQIDEMEDRINKELEEKYAPEDARLQAALNRLRENNTASALQKAKLELLAFQLYELVDTKEPKLDLTTLYELNTERHINLKWAEKKKPRNVCVTDINRGRVSVESICLNPDEERVVSGCTSAGQLVYKCKVFEKGNEQWGTEYLLHKNESGSLFSFIPGVLEVGATYGIRVKIAAVYTESEWSDIAEFATPGFKECCIWKKCPDDVYEWGKYSVDVMNPRIATRLNKGYYDCCTVIGNTYIPLNTVTSWDAKILKSINNTGYEIYIGMAPFDIICNKHDNNNYGWYFCCCDSALWSGPPHYYGGKKYGPRKGDGQYVHDGDSVGVVMDTSKGELSFVLNGVNHGVAYEGIPLDKPLVPCVLLGREGDSVELVL